MGWIASTSFLFQGLRNFTRGGYERAAKRFDNSVMERDLRGRICVVTGANQGLGLQTSKLLAKKGCTLYMVCRSEEKGKAAVTQVQQESDNKDVHLKHCDVSSLASIRGFAQDLDSKQTRVYLLVNNAGVMVNERKQSADGFELNFATNTLGTFALTYLLQDSLERGGPGSRVVTVSSGGAYSAGLVTEDMESKNIAHNGTEQYARDKRRQIAMMERFATRFTGKGIGCYLMHPGWVDTEGLKEGMKGFYNAVQGKLRTLDQGVDTVIWLALMDTAELTPGALYLDRTEQGKHAFMAGTQYQPEEVDQMWGKLCAAADIKDDSGAEHVADATSPSNP